MKYLRFLIVALLAFCCAACQKYRYETVEGDPLATRIYTLDNGLKVYMSVNTETPRIQTYVAVKVGGKNDPPETTGLAHYFEHLMFKGTSQFGTTDYEAEKPLLDEIEMLFEVYRRIPEEAARRAIYRRIDSLSYEASKLSIPNEYDKLMSIIGADGTNAYTTKDMTVYIEDIPSNRIEQWARIEADRFRDPVIRGFHTELETIYEEKNMSLTNDHRKIMEAVDAALFPNHPYGRQTVLGSQESLRNPSITNVKNYHATYYVPNNMAVCLSGDFDPDRMIEVIDRYFGDMEPGAEVPELCFEPEAPITEPVVRRVYGTDAESVVLAWRTGGAATPDADMAELVGSILYNGKAGLLDLALNQKQQVLKSDAGAYVRADYGMISVEGRPKAGQSLEQVRDLLLAQVARLREGDFDERLILAAVNNHKAELMQTLRTNEGRADLYIESFINGTPWAETVHRTERMARVTKEQVVAWARENLGADSYAIVFKRQGPDPTVRKIRKPRITPIVMNRDTASRYVREVQAAQVDPIEPHFVNYNREMSTFRWEPGAEVLYKHNDGEGLFTLTYVFETGFSHDPLLSPAMSYLRYLSTPDMSAERINAELYDIACNFSLRTMGERSYVTISGLGENMGRAMEIVEDLIARAQPDEAILATLKENLFKSRADAKMSQSGNYTALQRLMFYGPDFVRATTLTDDRLLELTSEELLGSVRTLFAGPHRILYFGPASQQELRSELSAHHPAPTRTEAPDAPHMQQLLTPENKVYVAHFDANQLRYLQVSCRGEHYDPANDPRVRLYNEYFGGGMNSVVFQEMREARSLAYSAQAGITEPRHTDTGYGYLAFIATQTDKLREAVEAFAEIIEHMPESETAFNIAKKALLIRMRTVRTVRDEVLWSYVEACDMGLKTDRNRYIYETIESMTLDDIRRTQEQWVRGRNYVFGILGDTRELDMEFLETLGPVQVLTQEELFGY